MIAEVREAADRLSSAVGRLFELLPAAPGRPPGPAQPDEDDTLLEVPDLTGVMDLGEGPEQGR